MLWPLAPGLDPFAILVVALALDAVVGDPPWLYRRIPHPVAAIGGVIAWLDHRLNRPQRSERDRLLRGVLALTFVLSIAGGGAAALAWAFAAVPFGWLGEAAIVAVLLATHDLHQRVAAVGAALAAGDLGAARLAVSHIVGRDPERLDHAGVARAAIESTAENFSDGVVAPAFWYLLAGFPGIVLYKAINTADSMIGHYNSRHAAFGFAAARLDDLVNWPAARLSGLLLTLAALMRPPDDAAGALRAMLRDAGRHRSVNAGWPEAAMAGALRLRLNGPRTYDGVPTRDAWMGDGRADATAADVAHALSLYRRAALLLATLALLGWAL